MIYQGGTNCMPPAFPECASCGYCRKSGKNFSACILREKRRAVRHASGCRKSPLDFFDSLHNASYFKLPRNLKYCRCAAQTPAGAGFLQAFDSKRGGSRPLVLPLRNKWSLLQAGVFRQAGKRPLRAFSFFGIRLSSTA